MHLRRNSQVRIDAHFDLLLRVEADEPLRVPLVRVFAPHVCQPARLGYICREYHLRCDGMGALSPVVSADRDDHRLTRMNRDLVQGRSVRPNDRVRERQDVVLRRDTP